jgi:predicted RNA-binding protein YlxR (DUF448 family)
MTPRRTCVGCGRPAPKSALHRFVREADGLRLDAAQRAAGRGGYLHGDAACRARFARATGAVRSLRWAPGGPARAALVAAISHAAGEAR